MEKIELSPSGEPSKVLDKFDRSIFLARDLMNPVLDVRLTAEVLWHLSPESENKKTVDSAKLSVHLRGMDEPVFIRIPCGNLGYRAQLIDVFLDLGSTTTKYIIRVGDHLLRPQTKRTAKLTEDWSLPRYEKARILKDQTGAEWARWVTELLTSLRRYTAQEHRGYLRSVHLTVPQTGQLNVATLAKALASCSNDTTEFLNLDTALIRALVNKACMESVSIASGEQVVVLIPEHESLAQHYLAPLKVLHQAAVSYHKSFRDREEERAYQKRRQKEWDQKLVEQQDYDNSFFLWRWLNTRPAGPSGKRPSISLAFRSPADWMQRLVAHPHLLDRVVLLDAGGLSLDIAVLESSVLVPSCSRSDATCGGEALSLEFAKRLGISNITSEDSTHQKARLGHLWANPANAASLPWDERFRRFGGSQQEAYREATHFVYRQAVTDLASAIAGQWTRPHSARCTILLTGGGSRNPHFQELVAECIAQAGLEPDVVDARGIQDLLDEARTFKHPLPDLTSTPVTLFTTVHGWALGEIQGSERMTYDKYAVVGGLLARAQQS
ncbi:hypothetical protein ACE0DR_28015 [Azotobacter sp. CWF10]